MPVGTWLRQWHRLKPEEEHIPVTEPDLGATVEKGHCPQVPDQSLRHWLFPMHIPNIISTDVTWGPTVSINTK